MNCLKLRFSIVATIVLIAFAITACNENSLEQTKKLTVNIADITVSLKSLDETFNKTEATTQSLIDTLQLTADEKHKLTTARTNLINFRDFIKSSIKLNQGVGQFVIKLSTADYMIKNAKADYLTFKSIIVAHEKQINPDTFEELKTVNNNAITAYQSLTDLQTQAKNNTAINVKQATQVVKDIISIGAATAKVLAVAGVL